MIMPVCVTCPAATNLVCHFCHFSERMLTLCWCMVSKHSWASFSCNLVKFHHYVPNALCLPLLIGIPTHLFRASAPHSRTKPHIGRGRHSWCLVNLKAWITSLFFPNLFIEQSTTQHFQSQKYNLPLSFFFLRMHTVTNTHKETKIDLNLKIKKQNN